MDIRRRAENLEFWSGRDRFGDVGESPRREPARAPRRLPRWRPPSKVRPFAAAALLAGLAGAWFVVGHGSGGRGAAVETLDTVAAPQPAARSTTTTVRVAPGCTGLSVVRPEAHCTVAGVAVDVRLLAPDALVAAYRQVAGAVAAPGAGLPACARGVPDERAWSIPSAPAVAVGRYACMLEQGHAAMWWTRDVRLFHAVAADADLGALFAWWRAHPDR